MPSVLPERRVKPIIEFFQILMTSSEYDSSQRDLSDDGLNTTDDPTFQTPSTITTSSASEEEQLVVNEGIELKMNQGESVLSNRV